jgi:hypothetical protein
MLKHGLAFGVLAVFCSIGIHAQDPDTAKWKTLIVYGDGFSFSVREPDFWTGDTGMASKYHCNIVFYPAGEDPEQAALVQVALFHKQDEKTQDDLAFDVKSYEERYPDLVKEGLNLAHKDYKVFGTVVSVKDTFHQYIAYINPGTGFDNGLSVAMNIQKRPATEDELAAFRAIIASLWIMKG